MFEEIFVHFRVSWEIVKDKEVKFTSHLIQKLVEKYKIFHRITSPYHPQVNGQVERSNKVIEVIFTKIVASQRRNWVEKHPKELWEYRTTWRNTTGFLPYEFVYRKNPLFPIKFEVKTIRTTFQLNLDLTTIRKLQLNQLNELD